MRLALLSLLSEGPSNGYLLIKKTEEKSGGAWVPSPGSVYPTLSQLVDEGLINQTTDSEGRSEFALTEGGRTYIRENQESVDAIFEVRDKELSGGAELRHSAHQLMGLLRKIREEGDETGVAEAARKIRDLTADLERDLRNP